MPLVPLAMYKTPRRAAQARNHQVAALLAPSEGLNYRDSFLTLGPKDAVVLNNFIAKPTGSELRGGYQKHVTGLGGEVSTLMAYMAQDPTANKLFAAVGGDIFDVTDSADAPTAVETTTSIDGMWSSIMFSAPTMNFLCMTSPSGGYWTYDATGGWVDRLASLTGFSGNPGCIAAWKNRLWITAEGTAKVYYLPVNSITGAASELDLGPLLKHGGSIVGVVNWTFNAGLDIDDYLVFFGSQGDVIIYKGTDPSDPATFALNGIWYMGRPPAGNRFFTTYGGDLFVLSELGLLPLSKMVNGMVADSYSVMSSKISPVLNPLVSRQINSEKWEVVVFANNDLLMIKPPPESNIYMQYVMFIQTGAWSTFSDIPMNTVATYDGQTYFGDADGNVQIALSVDRDGMDIDGLNGNAVSGQVQGGFNAFGAPANYKLFSMARPILVGPTAPAVNAQLNVEYNFNPIYASPAFTDRSTSKWDNGVWDEASWTGATNTYAAWVGVQNMGYYGSLRVAVKGEPGTTYVSSTVMYQVGGVM